MAVIGKTISHYKIISKIGEGGRGVVYQAEDIELKRTVALKFISPQLAHSTKELESLYDEARSASQLNHPNITTIYEIGHTDKYNFIAMEYLGGQTLKDKIKTESLSRDEVIDIAIATLQGIKSAHNNNIIHRDIKAENIMVTDAGNVKIMDFGLARNLEKRNITKVTKTLGTIAYMSPEQIEGSKVDQRSDIFSFGIVLYEMITGQLPFMGEHEAATLYSIVNEPIPNISDLEPDIAPGLVAIVEKAVEKKPDDRYQSAGEIIEDLNELKSGGAKTNIISKGFIPKISKLKNRKWLVSGIIILALILISEISVMFQGGGASAQVINSLAVLNFENMQEPSDNNRLGQILQELIIADLSDISSLKVFSSQRLLDIQKQLGSDNRNSIDPSLASEIAKSAGAQTILTGNVIQAANNLILTSQLVNTSDGAIIKSHQVEGDDIYSMVDQLTALIQTDLALPEGEEDVTDIAIADKTSSSVSAFQYYFDGIDFFNDSHFDEAIVQFNRAIEIDSTFSSAYYKLGLAHWWTKPEMSGTTIESAEKALTKLLNGSWYRTTKEKLLAQGALELIKYNYDAAESIYQQLINFVADEKEAWYGLGEAYFHGAQDFEKASQAFERAVELDPEFTVAYRHIFDIYKQNNEIDDGILRANKLVDAMPDNVWNHIFLGQMLVEDKDYDQAQAVFQTALGIDNQLKIIYDYLSPVLINQERYLVGIKIANELTKDGVNIPQVKHLLAQMYIGQGDIDRAIVIYESALKDFPDSYDLAVSLARAYQLQGQYHKAFEQYGTIEKTHPEKWSVVGKYELVHVYKEQGRYQSAIKIIEQGLADNNSSKPNSNADLINNWAYFAYLSGNDEIALAKVDSLLANDGTNPRSKIIAYLIKGLILAEANNITALESVKRDFSILDLAISTQDKDLYNIVADVFDILTQYHNKNYAAAIEVFNKMENFSDLKYTFYYIAVLAHLELGDTAKALQLINETCKTNIRIEHRAFIYPRSYYLEGLVNEKIGKPQLAKDNYETLLNIWQAGDKNAPDYQKVLKRLNSL